MLNPKISINFKIANHKNSKIATPIFQLIKPQNCNQLKFATHKNPSIKINFKLATHKNPGITINSSLQPISKESNLQSANNAEFVSISANANPIKIVNEWSQKESVKGAPFRG
jgi:uncharacterized protein (DUF608 family)